MKPEPGFQPAHPRLSRFRSVEAAKLLEHQMYFWGKDVLHPKGNLLVVLGGTPFRNDAVAHKVRCYEMNTPQGRVVLHSTGVCLQPTGEERAIAYLRPTHSLYHVPPVHMPLPCASARDIPTDLHCVSPREFPTSLSRLLRFVREYEERVASFLTAHARHEAWREYHRTARHGIKWLPPAESRRWLDACLAAVPPPVSMQRIIDATPVPAR